MNINNITAVTQTIGLLPIWVHFLCDLFFLMGIMLSWERISSLEKQCILRLLSTPITSYVYIQTFVVAKLTNNILHKFPL